MIFNIIIWELSGAIFITIAGSLLHFVYDWSNKYKPLALISAVNESTWEHLKIAFWPALTFSIFEYIFINNSTNNFIIAKASCLLVIPFLIIVLFYTYISILKKDSLIVDITIFILSIFLGQIISLRLLTIEQLPRLLTSLSLIVIILLIILFSLFTYFPPKKSLFRDPIGGGYGINRL